MTTGHRFYLFPSLALTCWALAACGMNSSQGNTSHQPTSQMAQSKPMNTDAGWITAPQKHNSSGLSLRYKLMGQPIAGQPLPVQLEFAGVSADDAQIQIRLDSALQSTTTAGLQKNSDGFLLPLSKGKMTAQTLTVTPKSDGMHYIQLQMSQAGRTSAASIAIRVGDTPVATPTLGEVQTTPQGEKIIVMPASK